MSDVTRWTLSWFCDTTTFEGDGDGMTADGTFKMCHFEIGYDLCRSDDHSTDGEEVVYGLWIEGTHMG